MPTRIFKQRRDERRYEAKLDLQRLGTTQRRRVGYVLERLGWDIDRLEDLVYKYATPKEVVYSKPAKACLYEMLAEKQQTCGHSQILNLDLTVSKFIAGRERDPIGSFTVEDVRKYLFGNGWAPYSITRYRIWLGTFFRWCIKREFLDKNPVDKVDAPKPPDKPISVLTPDEAETLMRTAQKVDPEITGVIGLMLFGGIRPHEACRLRWHDIKNGYVHIEGANSKTRKKRLVRLNDTLEQWLQHPAKLGVESAYHRVTKVKAATGIKFAPDVLRHTFVSYSVPINGAMQTALEAGHSESILFKHYRALASVEDANRFWAIKPRSTQQIIEDAAEYDPDEAADLMELEERLGL